MEDGRHHLPPFVPDARYALPHHNNPHQQHHHHHLLLRPDFDLPNVGGGGGAPAGLEASSPRVYIPPHLPPDPRLGIPQQHHHHPPPPLDFRTNGDLALDRLLLRREAHPDFRDFYPLDSPKFGGGVLREDPRSWEQPAPAPLADPFFERQGLGRERLPVESRLGPPRMRMEDGIPRGKRNRVVDEFVDGDGVRYFRVSSSDSHGAPAKSPGNHGYQKGYRDDVGRHPSNLSAGKGKKLVSGGNSYNHKISVPNSKKKVKTGTGSGKRINFDLESRKGLVAASPSLGREDERSGAETSAAGNTVDLDVSFKSNALVAKEIVVAPQCQTANSSNTVAPKKKKKIIKKKVKKLKPVTPSRSLGTPVANGQKKNAGPAPSSNRPATVIDSGKEECDSSKSATLRNKQSAIVEGELDSGKDRTAVSGSGENVKLVGDRGKEGGSTSDVHELCRESGEIGTKADLNSLGCSDDNPLNSDVKQCDDAMGQSSEKDFDGTVELQPLSKNVKASTPEVNPPSELVGNDACDTLIRTDSGELVKMSEGSIPSLHNNSCENHLVSVTSERVISETPNAPSCVNPLNSETCSSASADKSEPDFALLPEKKLRTNNSSILVAGAAPSDGVPKVPHVETEGTGACKNVRTEHKVPDVIMQSASQAASEIPSKPTGTTLPSIAKVASQPIAKPKTVKASANKELQGTKNPASLSQPIFFPSPPLRKSNKTPSAARMIGSRTWRRADNTSNPTSTGQQVPSHGASLGKQSLIKQDMRTKTSYVRKGNTLVRKSTPVDLSPVPSSSLVLASIKSQVTEKPSLANGPADGGEKVTSTSVGFQNKMKAVNSLANENVGKIAPIERPDTPPLTQATKFPVNSPQSSPFLESLDLPAETGLGISSSSVVLDLIKQSSDDESNSMKISDIQNHFSASNSEAQGNLYSKEATVESKQITYVKTKRNQLIAAAKPACLGSSSKMKENSQAPTGMVSHEFYYKKKKNQIVRDITASEGQPMQALVIPDDASNSEEKGSLALLSQKHHGFTKRKAIIVSDVQTDKLPKTLKTWTRNGINSRPREYISVEKKWVLPSLLPWKRMAYTAYYGRSVLSGAIKSSLSRISRKLQLSRKRDTLYTRSGNGFSLHKSAVLSIGGRSLKWSKSIEKRSKQACEEATLAFAAVEKEKRKKSSGAVAKAVKHASRKSACGIKLQPGERIFRIGSVRYKMDSSKRTLLRIPDEKVTSSVSQLSEDSKKLPFVPRRLLIGNSEYVRVGNGNKLVRDPKRLTRMLASEKVKWSLHTVRSRLAKKRQYCQFFTRFGKCNKSDGKCPYIHDPDKIAVCTKFLKGSCLNENCKLTHKVIPERMPDCSFFLQGLCSNESCPYRHVNVNAAASICEGFLKGYCPDGDECDKKHSYTCPQYESTGICTQRSTCRLHHPKKKDKPGKQSRRKRQKTTEGRYFVSRLLDVEKSGTARSNNKQSLEKTSEDTFISDGRFADYISLDIKGDDDDDGDEVGQPAEFSCSALEAPMDDLAPDSPKPDLDMVIKPIRLMQKSAT